MLTRWFTRCLALFLLGMCSLSATQVFAESSTTLGQSVLSIVFTVNGSKGPLFLPAKSRLDLRWSSQGAKECKGDWAAYKLKGVGTQSGKITRSRSFTLTCVNTTGKTKTSSIQVNLIGEKSTEAVSALKPFEVRQAQTKSADTPVSAPTGLQGSASTPGVSPSPSASSWLRLRVLSPNGDEVWRQGEPHVVLWSVDEAPILENGFVLDLLDTKGVVYALPTSTLSAMARSYSWTIPSAFPEGRYKVRIRIPNQTPSDVSDQFFNIGRTYPGLRRALACGILGDADNDQIISTADTERIAYLSANLSVATPDEFRRADVNMNGTLTSSDLVEVDQYLHETLKIFSGCSGPAVSVDLRANGAGDNVSVPVNSNIKLSWTSNAGRCLLDGAVLPPNGSISKSVGSPAKLTYTMECSASGSARSATDQVTVMVEALNTPPLITVIDNPNSFQVGKESVWTITAVDPDDVSLTVSMNWGDGTAQSSVLASTTSIGGTMVTPFKHTFSKEGTSIVTATVRDRRGAQASRSFTTVVTEAPRTSLRKGVSQFGALFEGYLSLYPF